MTWTSRWLGLLAGTRPEDSYFLTLLRLRYRLLWAQVRSRQGRLVLFALVYLFALSFAGLLVLGGLAAGWAAIRLGRTEAVGAAALGGVFVYALAAAVLLGAGVRDAFSDSALRRYPLSARQRFVSRHLVTVLDPTWIFALAAYVGLSIGLREVRGGAMMGALAACLLLLTVNYLTARVVLALLDRMMAGPTGMFLLVTAVAIVPVAAVAAHRATTAMADHGHWLFDVGRTVVAALPPVIAAPSFVGAVLSRTAGSVLLLVGWAAILGATLSALEARPIRKAARTAGLPAGWDSAYDRLARPFGRPLGPLVGKMLRYYARSPHVRYNAPILTLAIVQLLVTTRLPRHAIALAGAVLLGLSTGGVSANVFGFDGSGFRRYALLPVSSVYVVAAAAIAALVPGLLLLPPLALALGTAAHAFAEPRLFGLIGGTALTSLFACQALGLWTSILAPRPMQFDVVWGQPLSLGANATMLGVIAVFFALTAWLAWVPVADLLGRWWLVLPAVAAAGAVYGVSVWAGAKVLASRQERLVHRMERMG